MISEETTKRILITEDEWKRERERILAYDHPGTDWLFVQIENCPTAEYGTRYETYKVADLLEGDDLPKYHGDEFPEAIFTMF